MLFTRPCHQKGGFDFTKSDACVDISAIPHMQAEEPVVSTVLKGLERILHMN